MANVSTSKKSRRGSSAKTSQNTLFDEQCMDAIENPNMMVPWYLMASYAYYEQDQPILSDGLFDGLAKRMLECWDDIDHWHKELITQEDLQAGTLLTRDFPGRIKGAVAHLRKNT